VGAKTVNCPSPLKTTLAPEVPSSLENVQNLSSLAIVSIRFALSVIDSPFSQQAKTVRRQSPPAIIKAFLPMT